MEQRFAAQFQAEVEEEEYQRSVVQGQMVADAILAWADTDGYAVYNNCPYVPADVPGAWEPTPPAFNPNPQQPCWGQLRPMVLTSGEECAPPGHPEFSSDSESAFYAAAFEVYQTGLTLTDKQQTIAQYWLDGVGTTGTSSGHWIAIVSQIARTDGLLLAAAAEAYARVGIAVADVFITSFDAKYRYNLLRPVTYIQDHIDDSWLSYQLTPPNPSYLSGHATQSRRPPPSSPTSSATRRSPTPSIPITTWCHPRSRARLARSTRRRQRRLSPGCMRASTSRSTATMGSRPGAVSERRSTTACASRTKTTKRVAGSNATKTYGKAHCKGETFPDHARGRESLCSQQTARKGFVPRCTLQGTHRFWESPRQHHCKGLKDRR